MSERTLSDFDQILFETIWLSSIGTSIVPTSLVSAQLIYEGVNNILWKGIRESLINFNSNTMSTVYTVNNSKRNQYRGEDIPSSGIGLVNKSLVKEPRLTTQTFPVDGLDYPNKTDRPDITHIEWNQWLEWYPRIGDGCMDAYTYCNTNRLAPLHLSCPRCISCMSRLEDECVECQFIYHLCGLCDQQN